MSELIEFICPKCKRSLVWTLEPFQVKCNKCSLWVKGSDLGLNAKRINIVDNPEQLEMF